MKENKTIYTCTECGYHSAKWLGKCPSCGNWNCFEEEEIEQNEKKNPRSGLSSSRPKFPQASVRLSEAELPEYIRIKTGMGELDRVLGGGLVQGSIVLLSGEPGIGKSTLLTQLCSLIGSSESKILYVSGEESRSQLKLRAERIGAVSEEIYVLTETDVDRILSEIELLKPDIVIVDSIQTIYSSDFTSVPASVTQVKETAARFIHYAKNNNTAFILVGHVNKEGGIAGPKVLEHIVDAVLYFEGEKQNSYRIIRAVKNRFGSTNEIGVFEMSDRGLIEVPNPSEMLLADRPKNISGNCAVCIMEGTRPVIAEIQALSSNTVFPSPKRTSNGIDYNRACLLLAVLDKRLGLKFYTQDIYLNVIGGLHIDEPACDLAVALSLVSSLRDIPVDDRIIAFGEIGLAGECRAVSNAEARVKEAIRLGFTKIIMPKRNLNALNNFDRKNTQLIGISGIYDMMTAVFTDNKNADF